MLALPISSQNRQKVSTLYHGEDTKAIMIKYQSMPSRKPIHKSIADERQYVVLYWRYSHHFLREKKIYMPIKNASDAMLNPIRYFSRIFKSKNHRTNAKFWQSIQTWHSIWIPMFAACHFPTRLHVFYFYICGTFPYSAGSNRLMVAKYKTNQSSLPNELGDYNNGVSRWVIRDRDMNSTVLIIWREVFVRPINIAVILLKLCELILLQYQ